MDTYEGDQQDPQSLHKYLYCQADPINMVDPAGQDGDLVSTEAAIGIGTYLGATLVNYVVGNAVQATYLKLSGGSLNQLHWFEASDAMVFIPGSVILRVGGLPLQMLTKIRGNVVGRAFAAGGVARVVGDFAQWFDSTGGMLYLRTANGTVITLEKGAANEGFQHILQRHLVAFWDGTKATKTTLWPANIAPGDMLNLLSEASSKFVGTEGAQTVQLSNGITATLLWPMEK